MVILSQNQAGAFEAAFDVQTFANKIIDIAMPRWGERALPTLPRNTGGTRTHNSTISISEVHNS